MNLYILITASIEEFLKNSDRRRSCLIINIYFLITDLLNHLGWILSRDNMSFSHSNSSNLMLLFFEDQLCNVRNHPPWPPTVLWAGLNRGARDGRAGWVGWMGICPTRFCKNIHEDTNRKYTTICPPRILLLPASLMLSTNCICPAHIQYTYLLSYLEHAVQTQLHEDTNL